MQIRLDVLPDVLPDEAGAQVPAGHPREASPGPGSQRREARSKPVPAAGEGRPILARIFVHLASSTI